MLIVARRFVKRNVVSPLSEVINGAKLISKGFADTQAFKETAGKFLASRGLQVQMTALPKIQGIAAKGPQEISLEGEGAGALQVRRQLDRRSLHDHPRL